MMNETAQARIARTSIPGISMWSLWQSERAMFWNSFVIENEGSRILVDPLPLDEPDLASLRAAGGVECIVVTTRDHQRAARELAAEFGALIAAPAGDIKEMTCDVGAALHENDLICGLRVVQLDGMKSPGEIGLWIRDRGVAILGDALWGDPPGALRMVPDAKLADPLAAVRSLRRIRGLNPKHLLVGDGTCIFNHAMDALDTFFISRPEAFAPRINIDELHMRSYPDDPKPFTALDAEVGFLIGARRMGYRVARLEPGASFCPYHWHTAEEEFFYVISGSPLVRMPGGEFTARAGDFIAFPVGPGGAHAVRNAGPGDALILMVANTDDEDVCYYPDSKKVLVGEYDTMVRSEPQLDYFEGEADRGRS